MMNLYFKLTNRDIDVIKCEFGSVVKLIESEFGNLLWYEEYDIDDLLIIDCQVLKFNNLDLLKIYNMNIDLEISINFQ